MQRTFALFAGFLVVAGTAHASRAETVVNVTQMHLCCGACVSSVTKAVKAVDGIAFEVDQDGNSIKLTATDDAAAQAALDALANVGFHGVTDSETLKMKEDSGVKEGTIERLELAGIHNCCGGCNNALKKALAEVEGIQASDSKPKTDSLVVEGKFDGLALIKALNKHGFHGKTKPAPE